MKRVCRLLPLLLLAGSSLASGPDCTDFTRYDRWVPTPWLGHPFSLRDSAPWRDSMAVFVGGSVHVVDFSDPTDPSLVAAIDGEFVSMAIDGDLLAVGGYPEVRLLRLPDLVPLCVLPVYATAYPGLGDGRLVVASGNRIQYYDITDPTEPVHIGALEHGIYQGTKSLIIVNDHLLVAQWISALRAYGELFVTTLPGDEPVELTDSITEYPFDPGAAVVYRELVEYEGAVFVIGTTLDCRKPEWCPRTGFLARVSVSAEGKVVWGKRIDGELGNPVDVQPLRNGLLVATRVTNFRSGTSHRRYWFAPIPPPPGDHLVVSPLQQPVLFDVVTPVPGTGVCVDGNAAISYIDFPGGSVVQGPPMGVNAMMRTRGDLGVVLAWGDGDEYGFGDWSRLITYDLAGEQPTRLRDIRDIVGSPRRLRIVGDQIYLYSSTGSGWSWSSIDISDPANPGPPTETGLDDVDDILDWGGPLVYLERDGNYDGLLMIRTDGRDNFAARVRRGRLAKVGEYLYVMHGHATTIVDLSDLGQPVIVTDRAPVRGTPEDRNDGLLVTIDDGTLRWYDVSSPTAPGPAGSWDAGEALLTAAFTGNRTYVSVGDRGIVVLDYDGTDNPRIIGGSRSPSPPELVRAPTGIWMASNPPRLLRYECDDAVPVLVSGFTVTRTQDGARADWSSSESDPEARFCLRRRPASGAERLVGCVTASAGEQILEDASCPRDVAVRYELLLQQDGGDPVVVAAAGLAAEAPSGPLLQVAPNPANPRTTLAFRLDRAGHVRVSVHDLTGRLVVRLLDETCGLGEHRVVWEGNDGRGRAVASGTYLVRMETDTTVRTGRVSLVR